MAPKSGFQVIQPGLLPTNGQSGRLINGFTPQERAERMKQEADYIPLLSSFLHRPVSIFGSKRIPASDPRYQRARELAYALGSEKYDIMTGGGPGIMVAANQGAMASGARSVGVRLSGVDKKNLDKETDARFPAKKHYSILISVTSFESRIAIFQIGEAFIISSGGWGTSHEREAVCVAIQTGLAPWAPVIFTDYPAFKDYTRYLKGHMLKQKYIDPADLKLVQYADNEQEVLEQLRLHVPFSRNGSQ